MPVTSKVTTYSFDVLFEGLPDWAVPMIRIVPIFYTEDGYNLDDLTFYQDFNYWWQKEGDNYILKFIFYAFLAYGVSNLPLYLDLKCYFYNNFRFEPLQHKR